MKTNYFRHSRRRLNTSLPFLALALILAAPLRAQTNAVQTLLPADAQTEAAGLSRISGKPLHGQNQEQLGAVSDFLIEPQSGRLAFLVVPSGAGAGGQTYRLVPMSAVDTSRGADGLSIRLDQAQWNQVGTVTERELQGSINVSPDQQQRLTQQFALNGTSDPTTNLIRASTLNGHEIRSGNDSMARVEDVVIDLNNRIAAPLVSVANGTAGQKFLVMFPQLQVGNDGSLTTNLNRGNFQAVQSNVQNLTPTGFNQQPIRSAAAAVQQALTRDPSLAQNNVQVSTESRLVLRGTVENQQKKSAIENAAQQAAPGTRIDSELTVRNW